MVEVGEVQGLQVHALYTGRITPRADAVDDLGRSAGETVLPEIADLAADRGGAAGELVACGDHEGQGAGGQQWAGVAQGDADGGGQCGLGVDAQLFTCGDGVVAERGGVVVLLEEPERPVGGTAGDEGPGGGL